MQIGDFKILAVFDSGDSFADRYTVVTDHQPTGYRSRLSSLGLSTNPTHPQGFSQWCTTDLDWLRECDTFTEITFDSLPENVQEHVRDRLLSDVDEEDRYESDLL